MKIIEIIWGFRASNPLTFLNNDIDFQLVTSDGKLVKITKPMIEFKVEIDGEVVLETDSNVDVCFLLNTRQVGWIND